MGRIPEQIVAEVLDRADMLQIVGEYVGLKRTGPSWKGLCPFHSEKTPSFNVNPNKGFFKCFGCGAGGNLYSFLMQIEGWNFPEAVRHVAGRVGIVIPESAEEDEETARKKRRARELYQHVLGLALAWFEENLWGGKYPQAQAYLASRGVDEESARAFHLGYAPEGWSGLIDHMKGHRIKPLVCERAGLAVSGNKGHYDRFRDRLIFPVMDTWNKPVAFGGRVLTADAKGAKYINSPETRFYTKGSELYGLAATKKAVRDAETAYLVEGNFDVVVLYSRGIQNAVAPMGTALTSRQARLLSRYTKRVNVAFDGDKAGQKAILRSLPILLEHKIDARVIQMPQGEDPDSLVIKEGTDALHNRAKRATPIIAWALERILPDAEGMPIEERVKALRAAGELLQHVNDRVTFAHYSKEIARRLDIPLPDIDAYIKRPESLKNAAFGLQKPPEDKKKFKGKYKKDFKGKGKYKGDFKKKRSFNDPPPEDYVHPFTRDPRIDPNKAKKQPQGPPSGTTGPPPDMMIDMSGPPPGMMDGPPPGMMDGPPPDMMMDMGPPPDMMMDMDGPPPDMMGPPPDMMMDAGGPPPDMMGPPVEASFQGPPQGQAPVREESGEIDPFGEIEGSGDRRIPKLEGLCFQILVDFPDKLPEFMAEDFCDFFADERLIYVFERAHDQIREGLEPNYAVIAQDLANELSDEQFFHQISDWICRERHHKEDDLEQNYFDTIAAIQRQWLITEHEKVDRRLRAAGSDLQSALEILQRKQELMRIQSELDTRLQKKRA